MATLGIAELGRTLVLAPHPDDKTIGCGGMLALLGYAGAVVHVILMTDSTGSQPRTRSYPAARLRALRLGEMVNALRELGHMPDCLTALGFPDGAVPTPDDPTFSAAVSLLANIANNFRPDTVVMPWRDDDHRDHRATHALGEAAFCSAAPQARRLEYPIWGGHDDRLALHIDITAVVDRKQRALARHRSQQGQVVFDDPQGFVLPAELLVRCMAPVEIFFDTTNRFENGQR